MIGQAIYVLLLVSCICVFGGIVCSICDFIERIISRKRRAKRRAARHAQAAADMAEWDKLYQAVIINEIRGANK